MKDKAIFIKDFKKTLKDKQSFVLFGHQNPDGDAVGSVLAMYRFLKKLNKDVTAVVPDVFPDFLSWMKDADKIKVYNKEKQDVKELTEKAEVIICLDFNRLDRLGEMEDFIRKSKADKILIDHHLQSEKCFDFYYSYRNTSSTAQLVYEILSATHEEIIDKAIAESIYVGIMTDTGSFNHNCDYPDTFQVIGKLIEKGVKGSAMHNNVYNNYSYHRMQMLGYALENTKLIADGKAAYIYLSKEIQKKYKNKKGDTEGFVNYPLAIDAVKISALFIEKNDQIKISLRSKNNFSVNNIAKEYFEGGGHKNASGGKSSDNIENTIKKYEKAVIELLENNE
jgi:phosphoesterase RecJ-like protein